MALIFIPWSLLNACRSNDKLTLWGGFYFQEEKKFWTILRLSDIRVNNIFHCSWICFFSFMSSQQLTEASIQLGLMMTHPWKAHNFCPCQDGPRFKKPVLLTSYFQLLSTYRARCNTMYRKTPAGTLLSEDGNSTYTR